MSALTQLPVTIHLTRMADGVTVEYQDQLYQDLPDGYDGTFIWREGNYSCDCNRFLFFQRALNLPDGDWHECSDGKYRVDWIKDTTGKVWYSEPNEFWSAGRDLNPRPPD